MTKTPALTLKARQTVRYLKNAGLLTDADALTVSLLEHLCDQWEGATSATQYASLSKEIRACVEALPKPEAKPSDDASEFLSDLAEDD